MSTVALLVTLCIAQVLAMTSFANFAVLLPDFMVLWDLSNTEAGWIGGIYYAGYVMAVPLLVGMTDSVEFWLKGSGLRWYFGFFQGSHWPAPTCQVSKC